MRRICSALIIGTAATLAGCGGNEFDGLYMQHEGVGYVMKVDGDRVGAAYMMPSGTGGRSVEGGRAEVKDGRLIIIGPKHQFIYGVSEDGKTLECLSDNCKTGPLLGGYPMPRKWTPVARDAAPDWLLEMVKDW